jgi:hypothetical protein
MPLARRGPAKRAFFCLYGSENFAGGPLSIGEARVRFGLFSKDESALPSCNGISPGFGSFITKVAKNPIQKQKPPPNARFYDVNANDTNRPEIGRAREHRPVCPTRSPYNLIKFSLFMKI